MARREKLDKYIHLQRNRWLKVSRTKLTEIYHDDEEDKKGRPMKGREKYHYVNDIVISETKQN